jgi:hypothetical protein
VIELPKSVLSGAIISFLPLFFPWTISPTPPLVIFEAKKPYKLKHGNDGWEPILFDSEPSMEDSEASPKDIDICFPYTSSILFAT